MRYSQVISRRNTIVYTDMYESIVCTDVYVFCWKMHIFAAQVPI